MKKTTDDKANFTLEDDDSDVVIWIWEDFPEKGQSTLLYAEEWDKEVQVGPTDEIITSAFEFLRNNDYAVADGKDEFFKRVTVNPSMKTYRITNPKTCSSVVLKLTELQAEAIATCNAIDLVE
jgi:hypothetical protein